MCFMMWKTGYVDTGSNNSSNYGPGYDDSNYCKADLFDDGKFQHCSFSFVDDRAAVTGTFADTIFQKLN